MTDSPEAIAIVFDRGMELFRSGQHEQAREAFEDVLRLEPENALAQAMLASIGASPQSAPEEEVSFREPSGQQLSGDDRVRLVVPLARLVQLDLDARAALLVSRLASGSRSVTDLVRLSSVSESDVVAILEGLLADGHIARG